MILIQGVLHQDSETSVVWVETSVLGKEEEEEK